MPVDEIKGMDRRTAMVVTGLATGMFLGAMDSTIVDTAMPRMVAELGGVAIFTWIVTAYLLASTAVVPVVGKLSDIFGRRLFYLLGVGLFLIGSVLSGQAQAMWQLIVFRGLQGLGGGMMQPVAMTIIGDIFPGEKRAKMQAVFAAVWGLASVAGPQIGGFIVDHLHWRWVFYVNVPFGLLAAALVGFAYRESDTLERKSIDFAGAFTVTAGVVFLLLGLIQGGVDFPWNSPVILGYFAAALVLLTVFVAVERKSPEPVLDPKLFTNRTFSVMSAVAFLMGMGMFGSVVFVPWFIQGVVGVSATFAGSVTSPMMLSMVVGSALGGRLTLRLRYRSQIALGLAVVSGGFWLAHLFTPTTTWWQATRTTMIIGFGLGLVMPLVIISVQNAFPRSVRGVVTSSTQFFRSIGATLGVTVLGAVFNHEMQQRFVTDLQPVAGSFPVALATRFSHLTGRDAQGLVQLLLRPELSAPIPQPYRTELLTAIKYMMSDSLHVVFFVSMVIVLAGALVGQALGRESLASQLRNSPEGAGNGEGGTDIAATSLAAMEPGD